MQLFYSLRLISGDFVYSEAAARYVLKSIKLNALACQENIDRGDRPKRVNAFSSQKWSAITLDEQHEVLDVDVREFSISDHCDIFNKR